MQANELQASAERQGITVYLAGTPRGKGRPKSSRRKNGPGVIVRTPEETVNYEAALRMAAQTIMGGDTPLAGPLCLSMVAVFAIPASWSKKKRTAALACTLRPTSKPDTDNLSKVKDALNGVCWGDDAQVVSELVVKIYGERPGLTLRVAPLVLDLPGVPELIARTLH